MIAKQVLSELFQEEFRVSVLNQSRIDNFLEPFTLGES